MSNAIRTQPVRHDNIATMLLREMFDKNLQHATRMMDLGEFNSAERLLQSAITQVKQIASYSTNEPQPKTETITEV